MTKEILMIKCPKNELDRERFLEDRARTLPSHHFETSVPGCPKCLVIGASGFISH